MATAKYTAGVPSTSIPHRSQVHAHRALAHGWGESPALRGLRGRPPSVRLICALLLPCCAPSSVDADGPPALRGLWVNIPRRAPPLAASQSTIHAHTLPRDLCMGPLLAGDRIFVFEGSRLFRCLPGRWAVRQGGEGPAGHCGTPASAARRFVGLGDVEMGASRHSLDPRAVVPVTSGAGPVRACALCELGALALRPLRGSSRQICACVLCGIPTACNLWCPHGRGLRWRSSPPKYSVLEPVAIQPRDFCKSVTSGPPCPVNC